MPDNTPNNPDFDDYNDYFKKLFRPSEPSSGRDEQNTTPNADSWSEPDIGAFEGFWGYTPGFNNGTWGNVHEWDNTNERDNTDEQSHAGKQSHADLEISLSPFSKEELRKREEERDKNGSLLLNLMFSKKGDQGGQSPQAPRNLGEWTPPNNGPNNRGRGNGGQ